MFRLRSNRVTNIATGYVGSSRELERHIIDARLGKEVSSNGYAEECHVGLYVKVAQVGNNESDKRDRTV